MALDLRRFFQRTAPGMFSMLLSVLLHASVAVPYIVWHWPDPSAIGEDVEDGPLGDGLIGDGQPPPPAAVPLQQPLGPVRVALYTPPPPEAVEAPEAPETPEVPEEPPEPETSPEPPPTTPSTRPPVASTPPATPPPEPSTEPPDPGDPDNSGVVGQPAPQGQREPCDEVTEVTRIDNTSWQVKRDIIDYYASHLRQLDRQAGTATARGREGVPIGVRVYLPRCSVLRAVGLRNKDIILSINDRPVSTLPQAIKTWLALRNESNITVRIRRKGVGPVTHTYRIVH